MQVQMIIFQNHFILQNWRQEFAALHEDSLFSEITPHVLFAKFTEAGLIQD